MANLFLRNDGQFIGVEPADVGISTSTTTGILNYFTATGTSSTVIASTTPLVAILALTQGSSGTWFVNGSATWQSGTIGSAIQLFLWSSSSTAAGVQIAKIVESEPVASEFMSAFVSGIITSPSGGITMLGASVSGGGVAGTASPATLSAIRIG